MIAGAQSCFPLLAAEPLPVRRSPGEGGSAARSAAVAFAPASLTSPLKTRVGFSRRRPSGRLSRRRRFRSMFTPGSRACGYRTASGRAKWPNRDPISEAGSELLRGGKGNPLDKILRGSIPAELSQGPNLYTYVRNNPLNQIDPLGLSVGGPLPGWPGPGQPYNPSCNPFHGPSPPCVAEAALLAANTAAGIAVCVTAENPLSAIACRALLALQLKLANDLSKCLKAHGLL